VEAHARGGGAARSMKEHGARERPRRPRRAPSLGRLHASEDADDARVGADGGAAGGREGRGRTVTASARNLLSRTHVGRGDTSQESSDSDRRELHCEGGAGEDGGAKASNWARARCRAARALARRRARGPKLWPPRGSMRTVRGVAAWGRTGVGAGRRWAEWKVPAVAVAPLFPRALWRPLRQAHRAPRRAPRAASRDHGASTPSLAGEGGRGRERGGVRPARGPPRAAAAAAPAAGGGGGGPPGGGGGGGAGPGRARPGAAAAAARPPPTLPPTHRMCRTSFTGPDPRGMRPPPRRPHPPASAETRAPPPPRRAPPWRRGGRLPRPGRRPREWGCRLRPP